MRSCYECNRPLEIHVHSPIWSCPGCKPSFVLYEGKNAWHISTPPVEEVMYYHEVSKVYSEQEKIPLAFTSR